MLVKESFFNDVHDLYIFIVNAKCIDNNNNNNNNNNSNNNNNNDNDHDKSSNLK